MKEKYWVCVIKVNKEPKAKGFDTVPRRAAINAVEQKEGLKVLDCWSGWGCTEKQFDNIMRAWNTRSKL